MRNSGLTPLFLRVGLRKLDIALAHFRNARQRDDSVALSVQQRAAGLERLLDHDADGRDLSARLLDQPRRAARRLAARQKIVDEQNALALADVLGAQRQLIG